jgi:hypothetical protein
MKHHRTCGNLNIITNTDTTIDDGTGVDTHIVTNCGTTAFAITQRDHLQALEITTYAFGIRVRRVVVFKMSTRTNTRTPNGQCTLWRKQPLDRSSKILPYSIIEQITERTFTGTSLDEVQHSGFAILYLRQIVGYRLFLAKEKKDMRQHAQSRRRE